MSAGLLGVEKPVNPEEEPVFEALLVGPEPKINPFGPDSPTPPKMLLLPLACWPAPNDEGFWVFAPNNGFVGAVPVLLPERFEVEAEGVLLLVPNRLLPGGLEVFEGFWPNRLLDPPLVAVAAKEKVGKDFEGSDMVITVKARDERVYARMLQDVCSRASLSSNGIIALLICKALRVTPLLLADDYERRD